MVALTSTRARRTQRPPALPRGVPSIHLSSLRILAMMALRARSTAKLTAGFFSSQARAELEAGDSCRHLASEKVLGSPARPDDQRRLPILARRRRLGTMVPRTRGDFSRAASLVAARQKPGQPHDVVRFFQVGIHESPATINFYPAGRSG